VRIHHLALRVADVDRAVAFYAGVLGLRAVERPAAAARVDAAWLAAGGTILMLERRLRGRGATAGSGHLLALAVDDLGDWEARLAAAGVVIEDRTRYTLYLRDPDGHRLGLTTFPGRRLSGGSGALRSRPSPGHAGRRPRSPRRRAPIRRAG